MEWGKINFKKGKKAFKKTGEMCQKHKDVISRFQRLLNLLTYTDTSTGIKTKRGLALFIAFPLLTPPPCTVASFAKTHICTT